MSAEPAESEPSLKPGLSSTTFWMTVILQTVYLVNAALQSYGRPAVNVTPELSVLLSAVLALAYVSFRHLNRLYVNRAKRDIQVARATAPQPQDTP